MTQEIELRFKKKSLLFSLIGILVIVALVLLWQFGYFSKWLSGYMIAEAQVVIREAKTEKVIEGAEIQINELKTTTDKQGTAYISGLKVGKAGLKVSKKPYKFISKTILLRRGKNDLGTIHLELIQAVIKGKVLDYVSEEPIPKVEVSIDDQKSTTDEKGEFKLENVPGGEYSLSLKKENYHTRVQKVPIDKETIDLDKVVLVPEGDVIFVSNRDGKKGIYTANYDGSNQKSLIQRVGDFEDYSPLVSPHQTKVAFLSTRDGAKSSQNYLIAKLYLVDIDGKNLKEISGDLNIYDVRWSPDGGYIGFRSTSALKVYNLIQKEIYTITDPMSEGYVGSYLISNNDSKIVYSFSNYQNPTETGLFIADINGNNKIKIYDQDKSANPINFSEDGKILNYSIYDNSYKEFAYNLNTQETQEIQSASQRTIQVIKSPDKKLIAFVDFRDGKSNVYVASPDYKNEKKLTDLDAATGPVEWSQNGQYILFNIQKQGESARYIIAATGKVKAKKIVDIYSEMGMQ